MTSSRAAARIFAASAYAWSIRRARPRRRWRESVPAHFGPSSRTSCARLGGRERRAACSSASATTARRLGRGDTPAVRRRWRRRGRGPARGSGPTLRARRSRVGADLRGLEVRSARSSAHSISAAGCACSRISAAAVWAMVSSCRADDCARRSTTAALRRSRFADFLLCLLMAPPEYELACPDGCMP